MSHDERLTRHLRALAEAAVPDGLRPDPPLSARVETAARRHAGSRRLGLVTLAAALLVATLGLVLLSRVPDAPLTSAAQGPTARPTETPVRPEPVALVLDAGPQPIRLGGDQARVLLALPETPGTLIIEVVEPPAGGPIIVGTRPETGPLFSFDPALTQRLRLELAAAPGDLTLALEPGDSARDQEVALRAWVEAPAGTPQLIPTLDVPDGKVAVTLPGDLTGALGPDLAAGQAVDVYVTVLFADAGDGEFQVPLGTERPGPDATPGLSTQRVIAGAPVLAVTDMGIALAVSPQDAVTLTWAIDARMPFTLIPAAEAAAMPVVPGGLTVTTELPPGKVTVSLSIQQVSIIGGEPIPGRSVDVYLTFMVVDVDETFQAPLVTAPPAVGTTIASPLLGLATGTPVPAGTPQLVTQRTIQHAAVFALEDRAITLAVSPQEAQVLNWAINAQLPITLIPTGE